MWRIAVYARLAVRRAASVMLAALREIATFTHRWRHSAEGAQGGAPLGWITDTVDVSSRVRRTAWLRQRCGLVGLMRYALDLPHAPLPSTCCHTRCASNPSITRYGVCRNMGESPEAATALASRGCYGTILRQPLSVQPAFMHLQRLRLRASHSKRQQCA